MKFILKFFLIILIGLFSFIFVSPVFGDVGNPTPSCSDYHGFCVESVSFCTDSGGNPILYTDCDSSTPICCIPPGSVSTPTSSCKDQGGICVDVLLCGRDKGTMISGTDCDKNGEICCIPFPPPVTPPENNNNEGGGSALILKNPLSPVSDIWQLIMRLINIAQNIGVFVCVILVVWAGYLFLTSAGNPQKVQQAQRTLIWALVGFGVIIIAGGVPKLIYEFITGKSWQSL